MASTPISTFRAPDTGVLTAVPVAAVAPGHRVRIDYRVELAYTVGAPSDFLFLIHPARTTQQGVRDETLIFEPDVAYTLDVDAATCNRVLKTRAEPGPFRVALHAVVDVAAVLVDPATVGVLAPSALPTPTLRYLMPSRYCQTDQVQAIAWQTFGHLERGYGQVQAVVEWVRARTAFQPGSSIASTSAVETLAHRVGVCRDFAHLSIALLRALNYPARFTTAVDFGADPGLGPPDFHAYVEAFLDRWYIFDPTGISPTTGLIRIGTGRDAADVSFATIFGPVQSGMPTVAFHAIEDASEGIVAPVATRLAVSTAAI